MLLGSSSDVNYISEARRVSVRGVVALGPFLLLERILASLKGGLIAVLLIVAAYDPAKGLP